MITEGPGTGARGIIWNLDEIYHGPEDPRLAEDLRAARNRASQFVASHKGKLSEESLDPRELFSAIRAYESIYETGMKAYTFAYLYHSSDMGDHGRDRFLQEVKEDWNVTSQMLTFFRLELMALPQDLLQGLAEEDGLLDYRHFLLDLIEWKAYSLSEGEERVIKGKDLSGKEGLIALYDKIMGSLTFGVEIEGNYRELTAGEAVSLLHWTNRPVRERGFGAFLEGLGRQGKVFGHILNTLILDQHLESLQRGHPSPIHRMHLLNGVDEDLVEGMMRAVEDHYGLARRYFRLKARLLGLGTLKNTDLVAPLGGARVQMDFSGARELLLEAMEATDPLFYSMTREFFERRWIDAETRPGKRQGAFCKCLAPSQHPFVSMNYTGHLKDVLTLAHELGHGIHYRLASEKSYLNFDPPPVLAETASTLNEILLSQHLLKKEELRDSLADLYYAHIENILVTVYRQNVLTRFEQAIYRIRQDHLLDEEEICGIWWDQNQRLYGEDVEMISPYRWGWTYISHFIHRPFYCYSYVFGNLLAIKLYQGYVRMGEAFWQVVVALLRKGGSQGPLEILQEFDLDPEQTSFWEEPFQYVKGLIDGLERISIQGDVLDS